MPNMNISEGARRLRLCISELGGEASEEELEVIMEELPTMDSGKLQKLLGELEESRVLEKTDDEQVSLN